MFWHYDECPILFIVMLNVIMLSVVTLNVVMLSVAEPFQQHFSFFKSYKWA
jgi:hypothetical protein